MKVEIIDGKLIASPSSMEEMSFLYSLASTLNCLRLNENKEQIKCGDTLLIKKLPQRLNNIDLFEVQVLGKKSC